MFTSPLLSSLVVVHLIGATLVLLAGRSRRSGSRALALATSCLGAGLTWILWTRYDVAGAPYQLLEQTALLRTFGAGYVVGADGLTVVLLLVIEIVVLAAIVALWPRLHDGSIAGALLLQAAMIGVVLALDALLFAVCWAAMLAAIAVLNGARPARWRQWVLVAISVAALTAGMLMTHAAAGEATQVRSFDVTKLQQVALPADRQGWPFIALLAGFGAGGALMAGALSARPSSPSPSSVASALIATALVALPAYGLVRFNLPILPQALRTFVPLLAGAALVGLAVATVQVWRGRGQAVTGLAGGQLAAILLGLAVIDPDALAGSLFHPAGVSLALAPLALGLGPGRADSARVTRTLRGILTLAAIGMPPMSGFVGTAAIVRGTSHVHPVWACAAGAGLLAIALGVVRQEWSASRGGPANTGGERWAQGAMVACAALALALGVWPGSFQARLQPTMARVITRLDPGYAPAFSHVPGCGSAGPAPAAPAGFTAVAPCDTAVSPPK